MLKLENVSRIFTVILYMFSVSLGAILLSLYYVFLWKNPHTMSIDNRVGMIINTQVFGNITTHTQLQDNLTSVESSLSSLGVPDGLVQAESESLSLDPPKLDNLDYGEAEPRRYDQSAFTKQARGEKMNKTFH